MDNINIIGNKCVGCRLCECVCPKECISLIPDEEGFIYPSVDSELCVNCGICLSKCPAYNYKNNNLVPKSYLFIASNQNILNSTSSGGFCTTLSREIILRGGIVYGAKFDSNLNVVFKRAKMLDEISAFKSSKYVFSDLNNIFYDVKNDLVDNKQVLFVGLPCQIQALNNFLIKEYDKLITVSLICHGVSSPISFHKYLEWKSNGKEIKAYNFRYKNEKSKNQIVERIDYLNGDTSIEKLSHTPYGMDYFHAKNYRKCCYNCYFANINRVGDFSVGDFYGKKNTQIVKNSNGCSLVLAMTKKADNMLKIISKDNYLKALPLEEAIVGQHNLKCPSKRPRSRTNYYSKLTKNYFFRRRLYLKVRSFLILLPKSIINWIKQIGE